MRIVWKALVEYPGYDINRLGQIRNRITGLILTPYDDQRGYLRVRLNGTKVKVHRLVAKTYIPNPNNLPIVNHKRGKKHDNRASQLEWCTVAENIRHAFALGLNGKKKKVKRHGKRRLVPRS
jgi:hypothetical protein